MYINKQKFIFVRKTITVIRHACRRVKWYNANDATGFKLDYFSVYDDNVYILTINYIVSFVHKQYEYPRYSTSTNMGGSGYHVFWKFISIFIRVHCSIHTRARF